MKATLRQRLSLVRAILAGIGIAGVPHVVYSQAFEYVITVNNVVVRGVDTVDTAAVAHREPPEFEKLRSSLTRAAIENHRKGERGAPSIGERQ